MSELTQAELKKSLHYCPDTGVFTWLKRNRSRFVTEGALKAWNTSHQGKIAGSFNYKGYRIIGLTVRSGKYMRYRAHRLAWLYIHGEFPDITDHINGVRDDNRLVNLRNTTPRGNSRNAKIPCTNTSGILGVAWRVNKNKWLASIKVNRVVMGLGSFDNLFDAACARKSAEIKHGFHPNHGRR